MANRKDSFPAKEQNAMLRYCDRCWSIAQNRVNFFQQVSIKNRKFSSNKSVLCKPNCSIGGEGIFNISNFDILKSMNLLRDKKSEYVLQRELKPDLEGSIQFLLEDGTLPVYRKAGNFSAKPQLTPLNSLPL